MHILTISVSGAPQGKGRPRFRKATGFAYTPERTRSYEGMLRHEAVDAMAGRTPLSGPLGVVMTAVFPVAESWSKKMRAAALSGAMRPTKTPDADNLLKVLDAFNGIVWNDDKQVVEAQIKKVYGDRPRVEVAVFHIDLPVAAPASVALPLLEREAAA